MNININESSLSRVWQHVKSDRPVAIITAFRGEFSHEENVGRNKELASKIRSLGYGFFHLDGYWIENEGKENEVHVAEDSIFAIGNEGDTNFRKTFVELGKHYGQDGVLIKDDEGAAVYDQSGGVMFPLGNLRPGGMGEVYSRLRNNKQANTFIFEAERDDLGWIGRLAGI